jgi:hypothetical protein
MRATTMQPVIAEQSPTAGRSLAVLRAGPRFRRRRRAATARRCRLTSVEKMDCRRPAGRRTAYELVGA